MSWRHSVEMVPLILLACTPPAELSSVEHHVPGAPVPRVSVPLAGGAAAASGAWLVAADVDGDRVLLLDADAERRIVFPAGWAPSAVAIDGGLAAAVLRGVGSVAVIRADPLDVDVVPVCAEPRGVDVVGERVAVACASGELVVLGGPALAIEPDLRDVLLDGETALVSVLRAAEVLRVDLADGTIVERWSLPALATVDQRPFVARAARRMVRTGDGRVVVLHQAHAEDALPLELSGAPVYGTGACDAVARPLLTWLDDTGPTATVRVDAVGAVDVALWDGGDGAFDEPTPVVGAVLSGPMRGLSTVYPPSGLADPVPYCVSRGLALGTEGYVAGVAVGPDGPIAVTRFPFAIEAADGALVTAGEPDVDPGFALFHAPSPSGVSCATCHVDGREDGHTWMFEGMGPRRTQSLAGGLLRTAPYHWDGTLVDLHAVVEDTGRVRMGMEPVPAATVDALGDWLDALPAPAPLPAGPGATEGREIYETACAVCHEGPLPEGADVGTGGTFQIPSLVGLSARLPLMHDGCAQTIRARFDPSCGGDDHGPSLSEPELDGLISYLTSL